MKFKNRVWLCVLLIFFLFITGCTNKNDNEEVEQKYDYPPLIVWNDYLYINVYSTIQEEMIGVKIGEIIKIVDGSEKPNEHGESNNFQAGCNVYKLKDKDVDEVIAIEFEGKYYIFNRIKDD